MADNNSTSLSFVASEIDLRLIEFEIVSQKIDEKDKLIVFNLRPRRKIWSCPTCGGTDTINFGIVERFARDLNYFQYNVALNIIGNRHKCKICGQIFREEYESIPPRSKMTKRLSGRIVEEANNEIFSDVAKRYRLSVEEVARSYREHISTIDEIRELKAPKVLGIDEAHLCDAMRCVFVDIENRLLIEMLEKRTKKEVIKFLKRLGSGVEIVTMDMWEPYKDAVHEVYPDAVVIVDKFHVIKNVNDALNQIRRNISKGITNKTKRINLKNLHKLMLMNAEDLSSEAKERLQLIFDEYPELQEPYALKEEFRAIYKCETREEAEEAFYWWQVSIESKSTEFPQYTKVLSTIQNWCDEIFNYFDYKYTNAATESINNLIKSISKAGRGYNFPIIRAKILYKTKATKKPAILKSSLSNSRYNENTMSMLYGFNNKPTYKHGWGVDIEELVSIIENGNIFE